MRIRTLLIVVLGLVALALAAPTAFAQDDTLCAILEGCDLDGDGTVDVPNGTPLPDTGQYADDVVPVPPVAEETPTEDAPDSTTGTVGAPESGGASGDGGSAADGGSGSAGEGDGETGATGEGGSSAPGGLEALPDTGGGGAFVALVAGVLLTAGGVALRRAMR